MFAMSIVEERFAITICVFSMDDFAALNLVYFA